MTRFSPLMCLRVSNSAHFIVVAFRRYNFTLVGLSKLAGKVFRIGHLGGLNELMLLSVLAGTEMVMMDVRIKIKLGSGVAAAQRYWRSNDNIPKRCVVHSEIVYAFHSTGSAESE
ncbi:MAG: hypothetical protein ACE1Y1_02725 [Nitrosomonadaceae bacterium]